MNANRSKIFLFLLGIFVGVLFGTSYQEWKPLVRFIQQDNSNITDWIMAICTIIMAIVAYRALGSWKKEKKIDLEKDVFYQLIEFKKIISYLPLLSENLDISKPSNLENLEDFLLKSFNTKYGDLKLSIRFYLYFRRKSFGISLSLEELMTESIEKHYADIRTEMSKIKNIYLDYEDVNQKFSDLERDSNVRIRGYSNYLRSNSSYLHSLGLPESKHKEYEEAIKRISNELEDKRIQKDNKQCKIEEQFNQNKKSLINICKAFLNDVEEIIKNLENA